MPTQREDLHYHSLHRLERFKDAIVTSSDITEANKQHVLRFYSQCQAEGLSAARLAKTLWIIRNLATWMGQKDFAAATRQDIVDLVNAIQRRYSNQWTACDYRVMLKKFYRTAFGNGIHVPEVVGWIKAGNGKPRAVDPAKLLTEPDALRLIQAQDMLHHPWSRTRNKALIAFLYDSGVRVGELLSMSVQDLQISSDLWHATVRGKTGQRTFPIFSSIPYLKDYLDIHPRRSVGTASLWCSHNNPSQSISYARVTKTLRTTFRRVGLDKPSNPHSFRKSACTRDSVFMSDQQLKKKFGWTANSKELATYAHLRLEDLDNSFRGHYGLASTEKQPEFLMKPCPACHTQNKPHEQFCNKCKRPLALRDVLQEQERDRALEELTVELLTLLASENPQVKERFRALVERKNLQKVFDVTNPV